MRSGGGGITIGIEEGAEGRKIDEMKREAALRESERDLRVQVNLGCWSEEKLRLATAATAEG